MMEGDTGSTTGSDGWSGTDLVLVAAATGLAAAGVAAGVEGPVRIVCALALVLVLPGYALVAVAFPGATTTSSDREVGTTGTGLRDRLPADHELTGVERTVLSVASSLTVVPAVAFVVNFSPWPIALRPLLVGVTGTTLALLAIAAVRRLRLPPGRRFAVSLAGLAGRAVIFGSDTDAGGRGSRGTPVFALGVVASVLVVAASAGYAVTHPPAGERFTEFYVVTGNVSGGDDIYRSTVERGDTRTVTVAVENHERRPVDYTAVAVLEQADGSEVAVGRRSLSVPDGGSGRASFDVRPTVAGDARLVLLLYRGDPPAEPSADSAYLALDVELTVTERQSRVAPPDRRSREPSFAPHTRTLATGLAPGSP